MLGRSRSVSKRGESIMIQSVSLTGSSCTRRDFLKYSALFAFGSQSQTAVRAAPGKGERSLRGLETWAFRALGGEMRAATIAGGTVYVVSSHQALRAERFRSHVSDRNTEKELQFHIHALNSHTGKGELIASLRSDGSPRQVRLIAGETTLVCSAEDFLAGFDARSGHKVWEIRPEHTLRCFPFAHQGNLYYGTSGQRFNALHLSSGKKIWEIVAGGDVVAGTIHEEGLCIGTSKGVELWNFQENGDHPKQIWRSTLSSMLTTGIFSFGEKLYMGLDDGSVLILDTAADPPALFTYRTYPGAHQHVVTTTPQADHSGIIYGLGNGAVRKISNEKDPKTLWEFWPKTSAAAIGPEMLVSHGIVHVTSAEGCWYRLDNKTGKELSSVRVNRDALPAIASGFAFIPVGDTLSAVNLSTFD